MGNDIEAQSKEIGHNLDKITEINSKYNRFFKRACLSMILGGTLAVLPGKFIRDSIMENPYEKTDSVIEYKLTSNEIDTTKERLKNVEFTRKIMYGASLPTLEEIDSVIDNYKKAKQEKEETLNNLEANEDVRNYENWNDGKGFAFLGFAGLGTFWASIIAIGLMNYRKRTKLSELEKQVTGS